MELNVQIFVDDLQNLPLKAVLQWLMVGKTNKGRQPWFIRGSSYSKFMSNNRRTQKEGGFATWHNEKGIVVGSNFINFSKDSQKWVNFLSNAIRFHNFLSFNKKEICWFSLNDVMMLDKWRCSKTFYLSSMWKVSCWKTYWKKITNKLNKVMSPGKRQEDKNNKWEQKLIWSW